MPSCNTISSIVTLLSVRIMTLASSSFSSVVDVDGRPERSASITLVRPFLNISVHSYTLHRGNALSPYWVHKRAWISAPVTPSAHRNLDTSLLFFGGTWRTRWHVCRSIATHTLRMGTSHSQGQTIVYNAANSQQSNTNTLWTKKCGNFLKYLRILYTE